MNERRLARLKQQIKQRLAQVLQRDIADPKLGLVTITRIELDSEFTLCKAYWSVMAGKDQEERARRDNAGVLQRARGFCQREMAKVLHTRSIPHLEFHFDEGIDAALRMNKLLRELNTGKGEPEASSTGEAQDANSPEVTTPDSDPDGDPDGDTATSQPPVTDTPSASTEEPTPPAADRERDNPDQAPARDSGSE